MKPTYEELELQLKRTEETLAKTQNLLKLALERIAILEEKLNKNSRNSSKPPSTDRKPNTQNNIDKTRKSRAGINRALYPSDRVDHFVSCNLESCPHCGSKDISNNEKPMSLQQVELPEVKSIVTQFDCNKYTCRSCGEHSIAELPVGVPNSAFGPRLMALIASLTGIFHLSKREAMRLVKDLYDIDICEGSIINIEERVGLSLKEVHERIHHVVTKSVLCKHFDETSWRNSGKSQYIWVASNSQAVCFKIDQSRSRDAFHRVFGVISKGPKVTDRYPVYDEFEKDHQYCLSHLIRDFRKYAEREGLDGEIGEAIVKRLSQACKIQSELRREIISIKCRNQKLSYCRKRVELDLIDGLASGSNELARFCENVLNDFDKLWTFTKFHDVDPTNNLAERDLRKLVLWRKKSYGTRSERGQKFVERISSVGETLNRAGHNILTFISNAVSSFYKGLEAPYISQIAGF